MEVTVIIPTYRRPNYLENCIFALINQTRPPDEIIVATRYYDINSIQKIESIQQHVKGKFNVKNVYVKEPGHLPPLVEGIKHAKGDIVCFTDDDAEPISDWIERMISHYGDSKVGGVGGRVINFVNNKPIHYGKTQTIGRILWGRGYVGNFIKEPMFNEPREVDLLQGANISYRKEVLEKIYFDMNLNIGHAPHYEVDLGFQVRKLGFKLIYDPHIIVKHYCAPRAIKANRELSPITRIAHGHNYIYVMLKHLDLFHVFIFLVYYFVIGDSVSWGLAYIVLHPVIKRHFNWKPVFSSLKGKLLGIRSYLNYKKNDNR